MEDFEDTVFGTHYNRRNRETFVEMLAHEGWKYFQVKNLNELFALMYEKYGIDEAIDDQAASEEAAKHLPKFAEHADPMHLQDDEMKV